MCIFFLFKAQECNPATQGVWHTATWKKLCPCPCHCVWHASYTGKVNGGFLPAIRVVAQMKVKKKQLVVARKCWESNCFNGFKLNKLMGMSLRLGRFNPRSPWVCSSPSSFFRAMWPAGISFSLLSMMHDWIDDFRLCKESWQISIALSHRFSIRKRNTGKWYECTLPKYHGLLYTGEQTIASMFTTNQERTPL